MTNHCVRTPQERIAVRLLGERRARRTLVQVIAIASIWRTAMTDLLPMAGCGLWWTALTCLLPGLAVTALLSLAMRLNCSATLPELARSCLGPIGGWLVSLLLAGALAVEAVSAMSALIAVFTRGVGTRGTQITLALLTGGALLPSLHREGLARAAYLLRWVLLGGAVLAAATGLGAVRLDNLYPLLGNGGASVKSALCISWSLGWPFVLLLTIPQEEKRPRLCDAAPVVLLVTAALAFLCLTIPHEVLLAGGSMAQRLLLMARYAPSAVQVLLLSVIMLAFFLAIAGAVQGAAVSLLMPARNPPGWLPHAVLIAVIALQCLPFAALQRGISSLSPWLLLPFALLCALCLPMAIIRRKRP